MGSNRPLPNWAAMGQLVRRVWASVSQICVHKKLGILACKLMNELLVDAIPLDDIYFDPLVRSVAFRNKDRLRMKYIAGLAIRVI
jgi:hypothetical protein